MRMDGPSSCTSGWQALGSASFGSVVQSNNGVASLRQKSINMLIQNDDRQVHDHWQMKTALPASRERAAFSSLSAVSLPQRPTMVQTYLPNHAEKKKQRTRVIMAAVQEENALGYEVTENSRDKIISEYQDMAFEC